MNGQQIVTFLKNHPIAIACALLSIALGVGIYVRSDKMPEAEAVLEEKSTLGERIDSNLKNGVQLPEQLAQITAARQQIEARLVHPDELARNQQYFYKLEAETGIKLIELRQNPPSKGNAKTIYLPVSYVVTVRGNYQHMLTFLRTLENGSRYCRVNSANILLSGGSATDRGSELTLNLGLDLLGAP